MMLWAHLAVMLELVFPYLAKRLVEKNVSEMTDFVSGGK